MSSVDHPLRDPSFTSARVADTLDVLDHRSQVMTPQIRPLRTPTRMVGRAVTVAFEPDPGPDAPDDPYGPMIDLIDGLVPGDVVVIAAGGDDRTAYWGELFSAAARGHGAEGVVCDGYLRDTPAIGELGFPAFARGSRPVDYRLRMRVVAVRDEVVCGGVSVGPGDSVLADDDGIVVVPNELLDEVVARAGARAGAEDTVLDELLGGASLRDVWTRHRIL
jgi:4-hydroxy-4-methyl-2-oxoglutarate aldolase